MSGGGKGGSQTSETKIPEWLNTAVQQNLAQAQDIAQTGYTPYYGPDVAAFNPMQEAAFANTGQAANAFGLAGGGLTGTEGLPSTVTSSNGVTGYSSAPIYDDALGALEANRPGQYNQITNQFIDPATGAPPVIDYSAQPVQAQNYGGGGK